MARILQIGILAFLVCFCTCNIHRTISGNSRQSGSIRHRHTQFSKDKEIIEEVDEDAGLLDHILYENAGSKEWLYSCLYSIPASILVGSTGIFPLFIFNKVNCPANGGKLNEAISPAHLRLLLSFSVGGLFGDVFLHLLPEAWMYLEPNDHFAVCCMGLWIIGGLVCFLIIEKIFSIHEEMNVGEDTKKTDGVVGDDASEKATIINKNGIVNGVRNGHANGIANGHVNGIVNGYVNRAINRKVPEFEEKEANGIANGHVNGIVNGYANREINREVPECEEKVAVSQQQPTTSDKKIIGYLNLLANCIDNFTHGLAVAGSFIVSTPVGVCTTFAILLHEIPHEIGDFAILLNAGFNRWEAAKGQMITASGALLGCLFGLLAEGAGDASAWVLPFTSGSFIYISCATVIPDLLKETSFIESVKQMIALFTGIALMSLVSVCH